MKNFSIRKSVASAVVEYSKWVLDARMLIVGVLLIFLYNFAVEPLLANASMMNQQLNALEPFIAVANSGAILLIVPLCFMTLISDFPKIDNNTIFYIIRTGRINWLTGQLIRLVMMTLSYLAAIFLGSFVPMIFNGFLSDKWSNVATEFVIEFPQYSGNFGVQLLPESLYNQMSVYTAAIQSYILVAAYLFIIGLIMLFCSLIKKKTAGFVISGAVIALGTAFCSIRSELMWSMPMSHSIIWLHFTKYYREPVLPIWVSVVYLCVIITVLTVLCFIAIRRFNYDNVSEIAY